jgi:hypothetical protein
VPLLARFSLGYLILSRVRSRSPSSPILINSFIRRSRSHSLKSLEKGCNTLFCGAGELRSSAGTSTDRASHFWRSWVGAALLADSCGGGLFREQPISRLSVSAPSWQRLCAFLAASLRLRGSVRFCASFGSVLLCAFVVASLRLRGSVSWPTHSQQVRTRRPAAPLCLLGLRVLQPAPQHDFFSTKFAKYSARFRSVSGVGKGSTASFPFLSVIFARAEVPWRRLIDFH